MQKAWKGQSASPVFFTTSFVVLFRPRAPSTRAETACRRPRQRAWPRYQTVTALACHRERRARARPTYGRTHATGVARHPKLWEIQFHRGWAWRRRRLRRPREQQFLLAEVRRRRAPQARNDARWAPKRYTTKELPGGVGTTGRPPCPVVEKSKAVVMFLCFF